CFFLSMPPPPPTPTLFPYTTLFRSALVVAGEQDRMQAHAMQTRDRLGGGGLDRIGDREQAADLPVPAGEHRRLPGRLGGRGAGGDRKSTRLNSSHLVISYAVFCLKK